MARVTVDKNYFQFTQGKITEASPLSFPENSMKDELNIDINFDGTIQRRKGIDYEPGYTLFGTSFQKVSSSTNPGGPLAQIYKWENVGGYPKETPILVVRYGTHLVFYESLEEPLSSAVVGSMMEVGASESIISDSFLGFTEAKGYLFVVGQGFDPFYVKYDSSTGSFKKTSITIKIRDLDGLPEDIEDHIRPKTLTGIHRYNLLNQGWPFRRVINKNIVGGTRPVDYDDSPLAFLRDPNRGYPSNSDLYRSYTESGDEKGDMIEAWIRSVPISTSRAPRGKVIIEAFRENRKELAQEYSAKTTPVTPWVPPNYEERSTTSRPTCVTFFQGHVMFSGVNDLDYNDKIYVSQSLVDVTRAGLAYSVNDPTSGIESSPLDTDGGIIRIEGVDRILSLQPIGGYLLVIGNNGLWSIRGAEGKFSVNGLELNKLSSVGGISATSVVNYEGSVLFWSDSGIYAVSLDSQFDTLSVANITEETIQRDYVAIPEGKKKYANPIVDTLNRKIYWLYNNDASDPINCRMNRVLVLDMRTSSFFDYEFPVDENDEYPFVVAGFSKPRIGIFESTELVTVGGVTVTVNSEDVTVTSSVNISTGIGNAIKYLTFKGEDNNWRVLFSELYNTKFVDWASDIEGGVDYVSFVETGYELMDDSMRDMQATYIFTYFNRTEQGFVEVDDLVPAPGCLFPFESTTGGGIYTPLPLLEDSQSFTSQEEGGTYLARSVNKVGSVIGGLVGLRLDMDIPRIDALNFGTFQCSVVWSESDDLGRPSTNEYFALLCGISPESHGSDTRILRYTVVEPGSSFPNTIMDGEFFVEDENGLIETTVDLFLGITQDEVVLYLGHLGQIVEERRAAITTEVQLKNPDLFVPYYQYMDKTSEDHPDWSLGLTVEILTDNTYSELDGWKTPCDLPDPEPEPELPTEIGQAFGGGFYIGDVTVADGGPDDGTYAVIMAGPESEVSLVVKTAATNTSGTDSLSNGLMNTSEMVTAGSHPAAEHCAGYSMNGHEDCYMLAIDELRLVSQNFDLLANLGIAATRYASSTQRVGGVGQSKTRCIDFSLPDMDEVDVHKNIPVRVRPVRRIRKG